MQITRLKYCADTMSGTFGIFHNTYRYTTYFPTANLCSESSLVHNCIVILTYQHILLLLSEWSDQLVLCLAGHLGSARQKGCTLNY